MDGPTNRPNNTAYGTSPSCRTSASIKYRRRYIQTKSQNIISNKTNIIVLLLRESKESQSGIVKSLGNNKMLVHQYLVLFKRPALT